VVLFVGFRPSATHSDPRILPGKRKKDFLSVFTGRPDAMGVGGDVKGDGPSGFEWRSFLKSEDEPEGSEG
jgi:hypothetical protein